MFFSELFNFKANAVVDSVVVVIIVAIIFVLIVVAVFVIVVVTLRIYSLCFELTSLSIQSQEI